MLARFLSLLFTLLLSAAFFPHSKAACAAEDPRPPQLVVNFLATPMPLTQEGSLRLVYEMEITNFSKITYIIETLEAKAGDAHFTYGGRALEALISDLGVRTTQSRRSARRLEGGHSIVVFLMLDLGTRAPPPLIEHRLHVTDAEAKPHELVPAPLAVSQQSPIVIAPPLRGTWIAGDSVHDAPDAAHRRAIAVEDGRAWLAQRYAIDWVQMKTIDGVRTTWSGPEDRNESYFCYHQPILSVAAGKVIAVLDGLPENVPHSGKTAFPIDFLNAAGNHLVIEIAPERYVLYAHMRPGSIRVKLGERVATGDVLGDVGNSGNSTEPHLHLHIGDRPSFLGGNGVPYEFAAFSASGAVEVNFKPNSQAISFGPIGAQKPFTNDYPATNALVTFE